jgi:hypothetical protein
MAKTTTQKTMKSKSIKAVIKPPRLTKNGQNIPSGNGCLSTSVKDGKACPRPRAEKHLPYCKQCLKTGDPSLKAVQHPKFGKILIAMRKLPKLYYVAWWGTLVPSRKLPEKRQEWALQTTKGYIDAVPHPGSQLKFCACPGPGELPTIDFSSNFDIFLKKAEKTCLLFSTRRDIPQNHQVSMMYNMDEKTTDEFFQERGLVRGDVGTKEYPCCRKSPNHPYWQSAKYKATLKKANK